MLKSKQVSLVILFLLSTGIFSFTQIQKQLIPTSLKIAIIDREGNFVEGAKVTLYASEEDYRNNKNPVKSAISDAKGNLWFKQLNAISYFIDARKGDKNNNGEGVQSESLTPDRINKINIIIE
jgi:hypothetical protein